MFPCVCIRQTQASLNLTKPVPMPYDTQCALYRGMEGTGALRGDGRGGAALLGGDGARTARPPYQELHLRLPPQALCGATAAVLQGRGRIRLLVSSSMYAWVMVTRSYMASFASAADSQSLAFTLQDADAERDIVPVIDLYSRYDVCSQSAPWRCNCRLWSKPTALKHVCAVSR